MWCMKDSAGAKMYGKDRATLQCSRGKYLALDEKNQLTFQTSKFCFCVIFLFYVLCLRLLMFYGFVLCFMFF